MTMSNEERIARLEGGYEHLATKADVENLRGELNAGLSSVRGDLNAGLSSVRGDLNSGLSAVRTDFKSDISAAQVDTNRRIDRVFWAIIGIGGGLLAAAIAALVRDALV